MLIDCDTCIARGPGCHDCVINLLLAAPVRAAQLDDQERAAVDSLIGAGLVPPLRLVRAHGGGDVPTPGTAAGARDIA